jgi:predicted dehydrogenase
MLTRRRFLEDSILATAAAAAASSPSLLAAQEDAPASANEKLTVAIIGCGIRGKQQANELMRYPDCDIAYVCDPDSARAAEVAAQVAERERPQPKAVQDLRVIFDDKSVDAVFIATCNHWHALAAIWAMQAGKDAYVEKPVSHNVVEGRRIVETARKTGRICQGGTQNRSRGDLAAAVEYMQAGSLGEVKLARSIVYGRRGSIGGPGKCEMPATVDYNLWAGPASITPPARPRLHYDWHWVWDTGNGELGNNNIHSLDICRWGLGLSGLGRSVLSYGGRLGYEDAGETPNTQVCIFDYGEKTIVSETRGLKTEPYHPNLKGGWIFFGSEGIISGGSLFDLEGEPRPQLRRPVGKPLRQLPQGGPQPKAGRPQCGDRGRPRLHLAMPHRQHLLAPRPSGFPRRAAPGTGESENARRRAGDARSNRAAPPRQRGERRANPAHPRPTTTPRPGPRSVRR